MPLIETPPDPDGHPIIPLHPELDLREVGFDVVELGVRNLVKILWELGYRTVCSCAGHPKELEPYPWVVIPIDLTVSGEQLLKLAEAVAHFNISLGKDGRLPQALRTWALVPISGPSGFAIYLQPLNPNTRRSPKTISRLRTSADQLALYLEKKCKGIFS